jgi:leucyl aminopeptidase (aminopeptidase T)
VTGQEFDHQFTDFDRQLNRYSELIVKVGLNLQPGQRLLRGSSGAARLSHFTIRSFVL